MKKLIFLLAVILLSQVTFAQEQKKPLKAYVVTYKDDKGNHTGDYFIIYTHDESETRKSYVDPQAKLRAAQGKRYTVQTLPITKGKCGIIYSYNNKDGKLFQRMAMVDKSKANYKEKELREMKVQKNTIKEVICL